MLSIQLTAKCDQGDGSNVIGFVIMSLNGIIHNGKEWGLGIY